ncbi:MAG: PLP-dependent aspartate aminotransferase family protein [Bacteroidota bacterium]
MQFETKAIQSTQLKDNTAGSVASPLYLSTTFERSADGSHPHGYVYSRAENPNRELLESAMAVLENGEKALAFSSGMAAVNALFQAFKPGDHILIPEDAYYTLILLTEEVFSQWGLEYNTIDMSDLGNVKAAIRPNTKMIWVETPSNPQLRIVDIEAVTKIAHQNNAICVVDNTWATPVLQNPLNLGADISMHATTKYIGGHSDVLSGVLVFKKEEELFAKIKLIQKLAGAVPSPFDCWLLTRGIKTLALRVREQTKSAQKIAEFLDNQPNVEKVYYPGLASHANHEVAKKQMADFGAMLSFNLKGTEQEALAFTGKVKLFTAATSLGGVESLIEHRKSIEGPNSISPPNLIRISVGLENADDLIEDLRNGLNQD